MYINKKIKPSTSVSESPLEDLLETEKTATPSVIRMASTYWPRGYAVPFKNFPYGHNGEHYQDAGEFQRHNDPL